MKSATLLGLLLPASLFMLLLAIHQPRPVAAQVTNQEMITGTVTPTIFLPVIASPSPRIVIAAAHIDSVLSGEGDEAILLQNVGPLAVSLANWRLSGNGRQATFPPTSTLTLPPAGQVWCAKDATIFRRTFGFSPQCEWAGADPAVLDLSGSAPALVNAGGTVAISSPQGRTVDVLVYGDEATIPDGWQGPAAQLYERGDIPAAGQVWRRKIDPDTRLPLDTDQATDWSGDLADLDHGRQVFFPGWAIWRNEIPTSVVHTATATVRLAVGPDGLYAPLANLIDQAQTSIDLSIYSFEHPELAQKLVDAANRGVAVRLLLEGSPSGGIDDLQKWSLTRLYQAGAEIVYLDPQEDAPKGFRPRYRFLHTKFALFDGQWAAVGTENFNRDAMPVLNVARFPGLMPPGRRGFYLVTDAGPVVQQLQQIFNYDWQPNRFVDLRPFDPTADGPPADFLPPAHLTPTLPAPFAQSVEVHAAAQFRIVSTPEDVDQQENGLLALLRQAGPGDEIDWAQLYEHKNWGESFSNPVADPNPRLEALIQAARRGAQVRILLDSYFDDPSGLRSNQSTLEYVQAVAAQDALPLAVRQGNPTGTGIHAKVGLITINGASWTAVGSLNGGEISHKLNREVMLLVQSKPIYDRARQVFDHDWAASPP